MICSRNFIGSTFRWARVASGRTPPGNGAGRAAMVAGARQRPSDSGSTSTGGTRDAPLRTGPAASRISRAARSSDSVRRAVAASVAGQHVASPRRRPPRRRTGPGPPVPAQRRTSAAACMAGIVELAKDRPRRHARPAGRTHRERPAGLPRNPRPAGQASRSRTCVRSMATPRRHRPPHVRHGPVGRWSRQPCSSRRVRPARRARPTGPSSRPAPRSRPCAQQPSSALRTAGRDNLRRRGGRAAASRSWPRSSTAGSCAPRSGHTGATPCGRSVSGKHRAGIRLLDGALAPLPCVSPRYYDPLLVPRRSDLPAARRDDRRTRRDARDPRSARRWPSWRPGEGRPPSTREGSTPMRSRDAVPEPAQSRSSVRSAALTRSSSVPPTPRPRAPTRDASRASPSE